MTMPERIWGWKSIGDAVGRSERWAQKWGAPDRENRIPVVWICGRPCITTAEMAKWIESMARTSPHYSASSDTDID